MENDKDLICCGNCIYRTFKKGQEGCRKHKVTYIRSDRVCDDWSPDLLDYRRRLVQVN
jgi:hypothetical protein